MTNRNEYLFLQSDFFFLLVSLFSFVSAYLGKKITQANEISLCYNRCLEMSNFIMSPFAHNSPRNIRTRIDVDQ